MWPKWVQTFRLSQIGFLNKKNNTYEKCNNLLHCSHALFTVPTKNVTIVTFFGIVTFFVVSWWPIDWPIDLGVGICNECVLVDVNEVILDNTNLGQLRIRIQYNHACIRQEGVAKTNEVLHDVQMNKIQKVSGASDDISNMNLEEAKRL